MKKMNMRQIVAIIIAVLMLLGMILPVFASEKNVHDYAGLFTDDEIAALDEKTRDLMQRRGMDIMILTTNDLSINDPRQYAADFYVSTGNTDGVMLYIGMAEREVLFLTFGGWVSFFQYRIEYILDNVVPFLSDGDHTGAAEEFLSQINISIMVSSQYPPPQNQTVQYPTYTESRNDVMMLLGQSVLIGLAAGGLVLGILVLIHGRSLPSAPSYHTYLGGNVKTNRLVDQFLRTHTARIAIPKNNTSSGGGGGRISGGGGMARGGGGRKF